MKNVIIFLISIISFSGIAQSKYEDGMQKALDLWGADKPWEAVKQALIQGSPNGATHRHSAS